MRDDSIPLDLIRSHSLLWLQTNQRTVNQSKQSLTIIWCSVKPIASRGSHLVTEIDCSSQTFIQSKTLSKRIIPESLVTRPAGQGERRLWERDCVLPVKDGAYYCYCAYVLRMSRYSHFQSVVLTNVGIFLRGLNLCGESRT